MKYFVKSLIKNNTGVSSKNFFLVCVTIIGCLLLIAPLGIFTVELIFSHTVTIDFTSLAAYIAAVAGVFTTAGVTKVWSEKNEKYHNLNQFNKENNKEFNEVVD